MTPKQYQEKIVTKPEWFLDKVLGIKYWDKQIDMIKSVFKNRRTIVGGCTSSSKSYGAAALVFLWLHAYGAPSRVITVAPTGRQVGLNIWGYIPQLYRGALAPLGGDMQTRDYKLRDDWFAKGFSADNPNNVRGIHGKRDLIIFDDGQGIPHEMFRGFETTMAGGNAHALILCNKDILQGEIYDAYHSKRHLYNTITISAFDTPNVKTGKIIIDGMLTKEQVDEWIKTFGENDDFVRVFVKGEFPKQESNTLIPVDWLEAATTRENAIGKKIILGVDVAWQGNDKSVIFPMRGNRALTPTVLSKYDPMEVVGHTSVIADDMNYTKIFVDIIGIGAGVVSRLSERKYNVEGVNVSETKNVNDDFDEKKLKFFNLRSKIWWQLRESLNPQNAEAISIPNDPELIAELSTVRYKIHSEKVIRIEPKEETKARLKRSPDKADALCLANYGRLKMVENANSKLVTILTINDDEEDDA